MIEELKEEESDEDEENGIGISDSLLATQKAIEGLEEDDEDDDEDDDGDLQAFFGTQPSTGVPAGGKKR